jgi:hypothetical protein
LPWGHYNTKKVIHFFLLTGGHCPRYNLDMKKKITKYKKLGPKKLAEIIKILAWQIHILRGQDKWYVDEIVNRLYKK